MLQKRLKMYILSSMFAVIISVLALIQFPLIVPITMQTFGIFLSLLVLGGKYGTLSVSLYILLGLIGLPVFSGMSGGIGALMGVSGGYISGFLCLALIFWLFESLFSKSIAIKIGIPLGMLVVYILGAIWFCGVYSSNKGFALTFLTLSAPYIIPDLIKFFASLFIAKRLKNYI